MLQGPLRFPVTALPAPRGVRVVAIQPIKNVITNDRAPQSYTDKYHDYLAFKGKSTCESRNVLQRTLHFPVPASPARRGVRVVASAHGDFQSLMRNPELNTLLGGLTSVTVGDQMAMTNNGGNKVKYTNCDDLYIGGAFLFR